MQTNVQKEDVHANLQAPPRSFLAIQNLKISFSTPVGDIDVVRGISFDVSQGESVGIVGESGSGKTMTALSLMGLLPRPIGRVTNGSICFENRDLTKLAEHEMRSLRGGKIAMVFQDPMSSLSPFYTIGYQIGEAISCHQKLSRSERDERVQKLLNDVGINDPKRRVKQFPHEFSGGMRQRILIAMSLANDPLLLIADEPTTALDVTIQAQVLGLMAQEQKRRNMGLVLISHDWGVVSALCERVIVMYGGRIVEEGSVTDIWNDARHPYTRALLKSVPHWGMNKTDELTLIPGNPPIPKPGMKGCAFAPRCPHAQASCFNEFPPEKILGTRRRYSCLL